MPDVWEWRTTCLCCGMPIWLPDATFLQQSYNLGDPPLAQPLRPLACPHCKRVAIYDHFAPPIRRAILVSTPRGKQIRLSCEEQDCEGFLIVIAVCGPNDIAQEIRQSWEFEEGVRCSNGHQFRPLSTIAP